MGNICVNIRSAVFCKIKGSEEIGKIYRKQLGIVFRSNNFQRNFSVERPRLTTSVICMEFLKFLQTRTFCRSDFMVL